MGNMKEIRAKTLPPSSKYFGEEMRNLEKLLNKLDEHTQRVEDELSKTKTDLWWRINEVEKLLSKKMDLYAMQLYRKSGESNLDARIRLFRSLPDTKGPLLLYQKVNTKLLNSLTRICNDAKLQYWMWAGSLVATLGRSSSIPWDDDLDICMMRDDFKKLQGLLEKDNDFEITLAYDYNAKNIQYRFCSKNEEIHNFIDIVVCDWAQEASLINNESYKELNKALEEELDNNPNLDYWRKEKFLYTGNQKDKNKDPVLAENNIKIVRSIFDEFIQKSLKKGLLCKRNAANAVAYGLDNWFEVTNKNYFLWDKKIIFPVKDHPYDEIKVFIPSKAEEFCDSIYPGWPYIPNDIFSHMQHLDKSIMNQPKTVEAMIDYLSKK